MAEIDNNICGDMLTELNALSELHKNHTKNAQNEFNEMFSNQFEGTENMFVFQDYNFFHVRPLCCFLDIKLQPSNENYWVHMFDLVMKLYKSDNNIDIKLDDKILWGKMNVTEQLSIMVDMCIIIANNVTYLGDFIERPNGKVEYREDFANINENSGDCEDMANFISYVFRTFRATGPYVHYALHKLHQLSFRYECILALSTVNRPSMRGEDESSYTAHMTTYFVHKRFLLDSMIVKGEFKEDIKKLYEYENEHGYLNLKTDEFEISEILPLVLRGEGTGDLEATGKKQNKNPKLSPNAKVKMYQAMDNNSVFLIFALIGITNFFIYHKAFPVNIPTFAFTYERSNNTKLNPNFTEDGYVYGVVHSDLMQNQSAIRFISLLAFQEFETFKSLSRVSARNKFMYPPLYKEDNGSFASRTDNKMIISPNIKKSKIEKMLYEYKDKTIYSSNIAYNFIPPSEFYEYRKKLKNDIEEIEHVDLHGELSVVIAYFKKDTK
jgi:hypothetical protein